MVLSLMVTKGMAPEMETTMTMMMMKMKIT